MDVFEAIRGRRSIRSYRREDLPEELMIKLIDCARWAPSAGNLQPWEFVIVKEDSTKKALARASLGQYFIAEAPVVIVVCADQRRSGWGYGKRGVQLYCLQDTAAATQNLLLAAHALGLGACWVGAFDEEEVATILQLPKGMRPVAIVPVGYPAESPPPRPRRSVHEITHFESF